MEDKIKTQIEEQINKIIEEGIQLNNLDKLGKLVDMHKDLANEDYWNKKKEVMEMNYRNYGNEYGHDYEEYGRENYGRRRRDSRGRYARRGVDSKYQGEEMLQEVYGNYQDYSDGKEEYGRGNYGAKSGTMKSLDYMMKSVVDFIEMLKEEASSQEEVQLIQKYTKEISEM